MTQQHLPAPKAPNGAPPLRKRIAQFFQDNALFLLAMLLTLLVWEIYVRVFDVPQYILPAPTAIARRMIDKQDLLLMHAGWTLYATLLGFFLGMAVAFPLAVAIVYSKLAEKTLFTFLVSSQAIPKIALAPILISLLGFGQLPKIVIAFLVCFFPIVVSTVVGLKTIRVEMVHLARSLGASDWETFWKFRLPFAVPSIFAGLKVAITLAVIGAVVGEYAGGTVGLGYYQLVVATSLDIRTIFAIIIYLSVIGIVLFNIVALIERWVIRWDPTRQIESAKQR